MKKILKYGLIITLIIFASLAYLLSNLESDVYESTIKNFETDPNIKVQISKDIKKIETSLSDSLPNLVSKTLNELEKKYPANQDIKSLRKNYNEALIIQKRYEVKRKKEIEKKVAEKIAKEKKLEELKEIEKKKQEAKAQQNIKSNKRIAVSVICNTNAKMGTYFSLMDSLRPTEAVKYINYTNGCSFTNIDTPVFTQKNSTVMQRGKFYLVLFNGKNYGVTDISVYENP